MTMKLRELHQQLFQGQNVSGDAVVMAIGPDGTPFGVKSLKIEKPESFEGLPSDTGVTTVWLDIEEF